MLCRQYNGVELLPASPEDFVVCPFFMPEQRFESDWPFPQRLPLGAGWAGTCTAAGHEGARPSDEELKSGCNLGYANACSRLPAARHADASDIVSTWYMLNRAIPAGLNFTATGLPYWDTAFAGFFSPAVSADYHAEHK